MADKESHEHESLLPQTLVINFANLNFCRLCLCCQDDCSDEIFTDIFQNTELADKINTCVNIEILNNDSLPKTVCLKCLNSVLKFYDFKKTCHRSNITLQKYFNAETESNVTENSPQSCFSSLLNQNSRQTISNYFNVDDDARANYSPKSISFSDGFFILCGDKESDSKTCNFVDDDDNKSKNEMDESLVLNEIDGNCNPTDVNLLMKEDSQNDDKQMNRANLNFSDVDESTRKIIGDNTYTCDICQRTFSFFFDYFDHQEIHNGQLVFKCNKCGDVFDHRKLLVDHEMKHKIPCALCNLEVLPKSMPAHLLIHTDVYKCLECDMRHTSNASLQKHVESRHKGLKGFVCHICGKQSSCRSLMNRHIAYHSSERPHQCQYCEFSAKSLNILRVHTNRKHLAEKCVCEICAKLFKSLPSLLQHMKRIHANRKHLCNLCGKAFVERYNLHKHVKRHAKRRLHECKVCLGEFFTVRKLKEHMHSHRQGCVNCPKCGKEFFYKKYLSKHVLKCTLSEVT